jgi:hypothetical protein
MNLKHHVSHFGMLTLIAANSIAIWQFFTNGGSILEVLWIYWLQSVVIGMVNVYRILSTPLTMPTQLINPGRSNSNGPVGTASLLIRYALCAFFLLHYGMFHLVYAIFLFTFNSSDDLFSGSLRVSWIAFSGLVFALHHVMTLIIERRQLSQDARQTPDFMQVMKRPYRRILPMHFIIILGPFIAAWFGDATVFAVFMVLKTLADIWLFFKGTSHPGTINPSHLVQDS